MNAQVNDRIDHHHHHSNTMSISHASELCVNIHNIIPLFALINQIVYQLHNVFELAQICCLVSRYNQFAVYNRISEGVL